MGEVIVILSRRSLSREAASGAGRRRISRCAAFAETGFQQNSRILRSFGALRQPQDDKSSLATAS